MAEKNEKDSEKDAISSELTRFWELESLGIRGDEIDTLGVNEQGLLREFNDSIQFVENRYCEYREVVGSYLKAGIVELSDDLVDESTFYLPQHAVIREDKTSSRLRIVFDGTTHAEGEYSLNDCLHTGVNLYPNLFELLVQFRKNAVAYTADVKQTYLQILIDP
ncbi:uncharacterized protein LOC129962889 [Argiope bruennichi]|uniref:uncharacterized protein LOC129962889 n=1 Tax=Argiope bruennichi TaxID=94029 RepID=UPI0024952883|nr:uncharacterized protein LOC129962889 [Argiope bruennichi]